ncbi:uncharacterized protein LOC115450870 isoform X2 [Manduca sexta]|uniref:uncharacterized protein LOC115450870 isoform X2 n=1 Tax=Manduca sexta TaxID=7130 RepID=UPI0018904479|nr:uncharacterized protein LOC115450870 isoform X2 [Manduca sexta]
MLIKIQGLPFKTKYQDVKLLVRSECTITDFKLDNLVVDSDGTKKVLVTVGNEAEAFCLIKCLNGYRMSNCVLGVEAISTPKAAEVHQPQNTYEQRPGQKYPPQTRNDYPNQMANDYNRGPPNYGQSSHNVGPQRPVEPMGGRNEGWNSGTPSSNQWSHNPTNNPQGSQNTGFPGTPIYPQHPSVPQRMNNSSYAANRPQQSPNYGYTPKSNMPDSGNTHSRQDMRNIEAPSTHNAAAGSRYPASFHQDKPITIMKDNFQGPTMYQMGSNPGSYPGATRGTPAIWNQGQEPKSQGYPKSNPLPYEKYDDDRRHSQLDKRSDGKIPQDGVRVAVYKDYEKSRQFSPGRRVATRNTSPSMKKRGPSPPASSHREMLARRLASPERKISPMGAAMSGRISPPIRNMSPPGRRVSPSGRWVSARPTSPHGRRPSPSGRRPSPSGRRPSPSGRRPSPSARRPSPSGRRPSPMGGRVLTPRMASPSGRRMSPSGRRVSPGRRPQSLERRPGSGRRMSPQRAGRHVSPPGRRGSPSERRMSPGDRRMLDRRESPRRLAAQKRGSPGRRLDSPPPGSGAGARQVSRYSPRRHHDDKIVDPKMDMDVAKGKQVRPAYESQASSQAMYSGGYRQSLKENVGYPMSGARQPEQRMSPWHQERDKNTYPPMKKEDDRRDINEKRHSRQSRSPVHRDRSPIRDHYRTNSPVSRSPRRSWALEKRPYGRSPEATEAPPPPIWPGKNSREDDTYKNKFSSHEDVPKHPTVWERPPMKLEDPKRDESRRSGEDKARGRGAFDPNQREPKFNPRHDFEDGRKEEYQRQRDMARRSAERRDYREGHPKMHEESRYDDYRRLRSPGREEPKKPEFHKEFDKDFEDIYKRAQEFRKKAEQLRRSGDSRRDDHDDERREPHREEKYDRRRDNSPHRHADMDRHEREPDRRYEDPKYKERDPRDREPEWKLVDKMKKYPLMPHVKAKREKAADELLEKIMHKYKQIADLNEDQKKRVAEELKLGLSRMFTDMFGDTDVSFIEIVIKYQAKVSAKQEEAMVREVLECLPSMFRRGKRSAPEPEGSSKMARYSPQSAMKEDEADEKCNNSHDWNMNVEQPAKSGFMAQKGMVNLPPPQLVAPQLAAPPYASFGPSAAAQFVTPQMVSQMMVPLTMPMVQFVPTFPQNQFEGNQDRQTFNSHTDEHKLFLCKDDFEPFTDVQAQLLKSFLISQIVKVTETSQGWAPDLTLKGINTIQRYEISSRDEASKDWLVNLDFSDFKLFRVLVYTDEELWYERAAIWLPGHSRCRSIEPLDKLKLQNRKLEGVNIGKWKFVKKVVNMKGTRLYVDMPPSSTCALEKHKMMLSYELQKVNVILKAVAVDKDAFDAGLKEVSMNPMMLTTAIQNAPMPSLSHDPGAVQLTLKGNKTISIDEARKLKECIIYHLFRYLQSGGTSRVDFVKYGSLPPNHFGVVPENPESKRWLLSTQFGKVNRSLIVVVGGDESNVKYFRMYMHLPVECPLNANLAIERLRRSNQGVKGINFNLWKALNRMTTLEKKKHTLDVKIDLESVETLRTLNFQLDYVDDKNNQQIVMVNSRHTSQQLHDMIKAYRDEMRDSYDIANMDLGSSDEDVICLD